MFRGILTCHSWVIVPDNYCVIDGVVRNIEQSSTLRWVGKDVVKVTCVLVCPVNEDSLNVVSYNFVYRIFFAALIAAAYIQALARIVGLIVRPGEAVPGQNRP
jgi:hypothetical protein